MFYVQCRKSMLTLIRDSKWEQEHCDVVFSHGPVKKVTQALL